MVSIPNLSSKGRKIGVRIKVAEMMSMNMPIINSRMFTARRKTQGEPMFSTTTAAILLGICSKVRYSPKTEAPATMMRSDAEVIAEDSITPLISFSFMSLWMNISTKKA